MNDLQKAINDFWETPMVGLPNVTMGQLFKKHTGKEVKQFKYPDSFKSEQEAELPEVIK